MQALAWLADHAPQAQTTRQIAEGTHIRPGYLSKVLQALGRAGFVQSQRGLHGGFTLTQDAAQISLLDVVQAIDPIKRISSCPLHRETHEPSLCPLHRRLNAALSLMEDALARTTIAELAEKPAPCPQRDSLTHATR